MRPSSDAYDYGWALDIERHFDARLHTSWARRHWWLSWAAACLYLSAVLLGRRAMRQRHKPFDLRTTMFAWNSALAVFSAVGLSRMLPEFYDSLVNGGLQYSVCINSYAVGVTAFWSWAFALSKMVELLDTAFIILRKQKLIFLHWYHHATVLIYTWYSFGQVTASGRWFITMNFAVHSAMYSYYAIRSLGHKLPPVIPYTITVCQLLQMIVGTAISLWSYLLKNKGIRCDQPYDNLFYSLLMYFSYFALFAHYFYTAYYVRGGKFAQLSDRKSLNGIQNGHVDNGYVRVKNGGKKLD